MEREVRGEINNEINNTQQEPPSLPHKIGKKSLNPNLQKLRPLNLHLQLKQLSEKEQPILSLRHPSVPNNNVTNFINYLKYKYDMSPIHNIIGPYSIHLLLNQEQPRNDTTTIDPSYIMYNLCLKFSRTSNGYYLTFFFDDYIIVFTFHGSYKNGDKLSNRFHVKVNKINKDFKYNFGYKRPYNNYIKNYFLKGYYTTNFGKVCTKVIYINILRNYKSFTISPQYDYRIPLKEQLHPYDKFIIDVLNILNLDFIH